MAKDQFVYDQAFGVLKVLVLAKLHKTIRRLVCSPLN